MKVEQHRFDFTPEEIARVLRYTSAITGCAPPDDKETKQECEAFIASALAIALRGVEASDRIGALRLRALAVAANSAFDQQMKAAGGGVN